MLNEYSQFICLSAILIDYVSRTGKNYYPQVFLEDTWAYYWQHRNFF